MPLTESSSTTAAVFQRQVIPKGWFDPSRQEEKDPLVALEERLADFKEKLARSDRLATTHVYENPDFTMLDARQHRAMLHYLLYLADDLASDFEFMGRAEVTAPHVSFLDGQIARLEKVFQEWHGDPETDPNIPESFKQAMRELKAGQSVEMEDDFFAVDAAPEA